MTSHRKPASILGVYLPRRCLMARKFGPGVTLFLEQARMQSFTLPAT